MVVIVDANILISAILNINGRIADLIFSNSSTIDFVVPAFIQTELKAKQKKICSENNITTGQFNQNALLLLTQILIINDDEISDAMFEKAFELTKNIDPKDTIYVALAISLDALFLTGDLKLIRALNRKGFSHLITPTDFQRILKGL
ncbi:PIN domain-containing protein [Ferruginibacter sp.]